MEKYLYLLLILLILFSSCKKNKENEKQNLEDLILVNVPKDTSKTIIETQKQIIKDTLIIYFWPSSSERTTIVQKYSDGENIYVFQSMFSDFLSQYNKMKSLMNRYKINVVMSYAKQFYFCMPANDTIAYNLEQEGQIMGYILFDGNNQPIFRYGLPKSNDITNDIRNYFNIKNFSYYSDLQEQKNTNNENDNY